MKLIIAHLIVLLGILQAIFANQVNSNHHVKSGFSLFGDKVAQKLQDEYDYIIVGGGTAGCVLANRLTKEQGKKVLVLEAGGDNYEDKYVKIPAGVINLFQTGVDWNFESDQEKSVNDRGIYLCRGKMLGGSSCLNVLLYHRGTAEDYNTWASMANSDEWNANNVLPYFKKSEDNFRGSSEFHGVGGEYSVSQVRYENPLSKTYLEACKELNFMENNDFNDWSRSQEGVGRYDVNEKNGARCSAASGFLKPVMKRKNLKVVSSALVKKVNIQNKKTSGVDVEVNGRSFQVNLKNGGEVLLCGGAISSPHILMLSGVGPKNHLESHGIHCIENLPGVGQNLQDHPAAVVSFDVKPQHAGISSASKIRIPGTTLINPIVLMQWLLFRSGPLTSVGCDYGGFFKTDSSNKLPDLQMRFLAAKALSPDGMATYSKFRHSTQSLDGFSFQSIVARPHSVGSVSLKSNNPRDHPSIKTGYLSDTRDLKTIREGLKLSRKIAKTSSFAKYIGKEVFPGEHVQSDAELDHYIREYVHTSNALVGSCRMGTDGQSVVDAHLKVHGIAGLRVVDASVIPKIPGGQTAAPVVMVAEKAADLLLKH